MGKPGVLKYMMIAEGQPLLWGSPVSNKGKAAEESQHKLGPPAIQNVLLSLITDLPRAEATYTILSSSLKPVPILVNLAPFD